MSSASIHKPSFSLKPKFLSREALAGGLAGGVARFLTSPFDVIKIRYQLQSDVNPKYKSMFQSFSTIIKEEGVTALWKGNLSATYLWVAYAMVQFGSYGMLKNVMTSIPDPFAASRMKRLGNGNNNNYDHSSNIVTDEAESTHWKSLMVFTAGALSAIAATVVTYPFDIMRTQFALQGATKHYNSIPSFLINTMKTQGVSGFYKGVGPAVLGVAPYMGLNFAIYEAVNYYLEANNNSNNINSNVNSNNINMIHPDQTLLSSPQEESSKFMSSLVKVAKKGVIGGVAGGVSKFVVFPLDTVKRRLQAQVLKSSFDTTISSVGASSIIKYSGLVDCVSNIWKNEGMRGFYKGIIPTTAKAITATAITFAAFEVSRDFIGRLEGVASHRNNNNNNSSNSSI
jgi:solute carrier family 25 thiamine pyrophosphate transporter 19